MEHRNLNFSGDIVLLGLNLDQTLVYEANEVYLVMPEKIHG